jgi:hypothetical protein
MIRERFEEADPAANALRSLETRHTPQRAFIPYKVYSGFWSAQVESCAPVHSVLALAVERREQRDGETNKLAQGSSTGLSDSPPGSSC